VEDDTYYRRYALGRCVFLGSSLYADVLFASVASNNLIGAVFALRSQICSSETSDDPPSAHCRRPEG